jgi:imidazoleglycerol-phosphate dehydratase
VREFFRAFSAHSGITLHLKKIHGDNDHHVCEALFKGVGRALFEATRKTERYGGTSTKGKKD